jgi:hypothetical protein
MTTPPPSPILDHNDTAGLQTWPDDPSIPYLGCLPRRRLFQRYSCSPLTSASAIHQTVAEALFLEPILLLKSESMPDPNHNDTAAALTDPSLSPTPSASASAGSPIIDRRQQQATSNATKTDRPSTINIDDTMAAKTCVFRPAYIAVAALLCHPSSWCARRIQSTSISLDTTRLLASSRRDEHKANVIQRRTFIHRYKHKAPLDSTPLNRDIIGQLKGGAISNRQTKSLNEQKPNQSNNILTITSIAVVSLTVLFSVLNWETLVLSLSTFFDRKKIRKSIFDTLNSISAKGTRGLLLYTFGFIFWETCGLPTSVVETAAGMAFAFSNALLCSFVGKTLGSILAFTLGRSLCHSFVKKQLQDNEVLELMEKSVARIRYQFHN